MRGTVCRLRRGALAEVSLAAIALAAFPACAAAQSPPTAQPDPAGQAGVAESTSPASADASPASDIIVTGTRLRNPDFKSPTPLVSVGAEALADRAATQVTTVLYELPSVQPAPSPNATSQLGGNFVNLRGFGTGVSAASRTLVLVDGHRFVPTNNQGQVDLNVIPTALVDRIDIVTGGASAAYGSDAVAGVVNVILRKKLDGIRGNVQYGLTERGDARNVSASLAGGTSFAEGRGEILIAGEYSKLSDVPRQGDRSYSNKHSGFASNGTNIVRIDGQTLGGYTNGGVIIAANGGRLPTTSPLYGRQFLSSTASSPFTYGTPVLGIGNTQIGGDGGWLGDSLLLTAPNERQSVYGRVSYEFSPAVKLWAEGSYMRSRADVDLYTNAVRSGNVEPYIVENRLVSNYDAAGNLLGTTPNLLIPADVRAIMTANNIPSITIGRIAPDLGNLHSDSRVRVIRGAAGIDGDLGSGWTWNAYYTHGETKFATDLSNNIIEPNLAAALDVVYLNGAATCRVNVPGLGTGTGLSLNHSPGCVVANPFGPGSLASAKGYVTGTLTNIVDYHQDAAGLSVGGEPFSTWAGPVSFTVGGEWRKEKLRQAVSPFSDLVNGFLLPTGSFQQANPKSFRGSVNVKEAFAEVGIPLLRDSSIGKSLDLNGAVRYTDYSTSGAVTTWKVGATYEPIEGLVFRGVRSRDIRAANLTQLYGLSTGAANGLRLQNNAAANIVLLNVGNVNLKPEKADTTSFGVTLSPRFLPGLSISIDYYKINLQGFIGQLTSQNILDLCFGSNRVGSTVAVADPAACNAYVSGPAGTGLTALAGAGPYTLRSPQLNVGRLNTNGIDYEFDYRMNLSAIFPKTESSLTTRFLLTYVDKLIYNTSGALAVDRAGDQSGVPNWRWTLTEALRVGRFTLFAEGRYTGKLDLDKSITNAAQLPVNRKLPAVFYLNLNAAVKVMDTPRGSVDFYINVNNVFDKDPPFTGPAIPPASSVSQTSATSASFTNIAWYDVLGRTYTVGVRFKF